MAGGMKGAYPPPPAPMRRPGPNGVLLWSLVGCGVIALLVVVIGGVSVTRMFGNSKAKGMFSVMASVGPTGESVAKVGDGIEAYRKDHGGQYPPTLDALVPKYVADKSAFLFSNTEDPKPMEYTVPKPDAADGTVVVRVHIGDITMVATQVQRMYVCLLKNGEVVSDQNVRTMLPRHGMGRAKPIRTY